MQLLPINETGSDNSPYNAISSIAIDPVTIFVSPDAIKDLSREDFHAITVGSDLPASRAGPVKYPKVKALKRELLLKAFERFCENDVRRNTSRSKKFRAFVRNQAAWLEGYALFRVLIDENEGDERWDRWPEEQRTFAFAVKWLREQSVFKRKELDKKIKFCMYVQWIAWSQWIELKAHCDKRGVALMGDVPFGVSYYSSDVFSQPEIFDLSWWGERRRRGTSRSTPSLKSGGRTGVSRFIAGTLWQRMVTHGGVAGSTWSVRFFIFFASTTSSAFIGSTGFRGAPGKTTNIFLSARKKRDCEPAGGFRDSIRAMIRLGRTVRTTALRGKCI